MRRILVITCWFGVLILAPPMLAEDETEQVETWPDGTVKIQFTVDSAGRRVGKYVEFYASGKTKIKCAYRDGKLHGTYASYHENGRRHLYTRYRNGRLQGKYTEKAADRTLVVTAKYFEGLLDGERIFHRGKTVLSEQKWKKGKLLRIDGIDPYPRDVEEIVHRRMGIARSGGHPEDPEAADREDGLRLLKEYRYVVGVPYEALTLDKELNARARAGARICSLLGRIEHEPLNPGLPDDEYQFGLVGTKNCNLHMVGSTVAAIHGYMDDSDPTNIDRVGHRAWCLNPEMGKTGFGVVGRACAMWVMDQSGKVEFDFDLLTYPARGYMPADLFGERHAFSVWAVPGGALDSLKNVKAAIYRLNEDYLRAEEPLPLDYHRYSTAMRGPGRALIFRPKAIDLTPGSRYAVVLQGLDPTKPYWFLVEFL